MLKVYEKGTQYCFQTAYYIAKKNMPYSDFESLVCLQQSKGVNMGYILLSRLSATNIIIIIIIIIMYFSQQQEEQTKKQPTQYRKKNTATQKHNNSLNEITKLKLREMKKRLNIHKEKK